MKSLIETMRGESYTEEEFFERLTPDLLSARRSITLSSGYISQARLERLELVLATRAQAGVRVCTFIEEPKFWRRPWSALDPNMRNRFKHIEACMQHLRELKVHANFVPATHIKVAAIDNTIIWDGSLNILSYNTRKGERMTRWVDPVKCARELKRHNLQFCPDCESRPRSRIDPRELDVESDTIGGIIIERRKTLGLSQSELASMVGLTRKSLRNIEMGFHCPNSDTLIKLAKVLGRRVVLLPPHVLPNVREIIELEYEPEEVNNALIGKMG